MPNYVQIQFAIRDAKNGSRIASREINLPAATTMTDALTFLNNILPIINDLTTGQIFYAGVAFYPDISGLGLRTFPQLTADNEETGDFDFLTGTEGTTLISIPSFNESKIINNSPLIDTSDPDVAAFITAMVDGISGVEPIDSHGDDLTGLAGASEGWKPKRKRRR